MKAGSLSLNIADPQQLYFEDGDESSAKLYVCEVHSKESTRDLRVGKMFWGEGGTRNVPAQGQYTEQIPYYSFPNPVMDSA